MFENLHISLKKLIPGIKLLLASDGTNLRKLLIALRAFLMIQKLKNCHYIPIVMHWYT